MWTRPVGATQVLQEKNETNYLKTKQVETNLLCQRFPGLQKVSLKIPGLPKLDGYTSKPRTPL